MPRRRPVTLDDWREVIGRNCYDRSQLANPGRIVRVVAHGVRLKVPGGLVVTIKFHDCVVGLLQPTYKGKAKPVKPEPVSEPAVFDPRTRKIPVKGIRK